MGWWKSAWKAEACAAAWVAEEMVAAALSSESSLAAALSSEAGVSGMLVAAGTVDSPSTADAARGDGSMLDAELLSSRDESMASSMMSS
jgi:hypothetical protein